MNRYKVQKGQDFWEDEIVDTTIEPWEKSDWPEGKGFLTICLCPDLKTANFICDKLNKPSEDRTPGTMKGKIKLSKDFDEPLTELEMIEKSAKAAIKNRDNPSAIFDPYNLDIEGLAESLRKIDQEE